MKNDPKNSNQQEESFSLPENKFKRRTYLTRTEIHTKTTDSYNKAERRLIKKWFPSLHSVFDRQIGLNNLNNQAIKQSVRLHNEQNDEFITSNLKLDQKQLSIGQLRALHEAYQSPKNTSPEPLPFMNVKHNIEKGGWIDDFNISKKDAEGNYYLDTNSQNQIWLLANILQNINSPEANQKIDLFIQQQKDQYQLSSNHGNNIEKNNSEIIIDHSHKLSTYYTPDFETYLKNTHGKKGIKIPEGTIIITNKTTGESKSIPITEYETALLLNKTNITLDNIKKNLFLHQARQQGINVNQKFLNQQDTDSNREQITNQIKEEFEIKTSDAQQTKNVTKESFLRSIKKNLLDFCIEKEFLSKENRQEFNIDLRFSQKFPRELSKTQKDILRDQNTRQIFISKLKTGEEIKLTDLNSTLAEQLNTRDKSILGTYEKNSLVKKLEAPIPKKNGIKNGNGKSINERYSFAQEMNRYALSKPDMPWTPEMCEKYINLELEKGPHQLIHQKSLDFLYEQGLISSIKQVLSLASGPHEEIRAFNKLTQDHPEISLPHFYNVDITADMLNLSKQQMQNKGLGQLETHCHDIIGNVNNLSNLNLPHHEFDMIECSSWRDITGGYPKHQENILLKNIWFQALEHLKIGGIIKFSTHRKYSPEFVSILENKLGLKIITHNTQFKLLDTDLHTRLENMNRVNFIAIKTKPISQTDYQTHSQNLSVYEDIGFYEKYIRQIRHTDNPKKLHNIKFELFILLKQAYQEQDETKVINFNTLIEFIDNKLLKLSQTEQVPDITLVDHDTPTETPETPENPSNDTQSKQIMDDEQKIDLSIAIARYPEQHNYDLDALKTALQYLHGQLDTSTCRDIYNYYLSNPKLHHLLPEVIHLVNSLERPEIIINENIFPYLTNHESLQEAVWSILLTHPQIYLTSILGDSKLNHEFKTKYLQSISWSQGNTIKALENYFFNNSNRDWHQFILEQLQTHQQKINLPIGLRFHPDFSKYYLNLSSEQPKDENDFSESELEAIFKYMGINEKISVFEKTINLLEQKTEQNLNINLLDKLVHFLNNNDPKIQALCKLQLKNWYPLLLHYESTLTDLRLRLSILALLRDYSSKTEEQDKFQQKIEDLDYQRKFQEFFQRYLKTGVPIDQTLKESIKKDLDNFVNQPHLRHYSGLPSWIAKKYQLTTLSNLSKQEQLTNLILEVIKENYSNTYLKYLMLENKYYKKTPAGQKEKWQDLVDIMTEANNDTVTKDLILQRFPGDYQKTLLETIQKNKYHTFKDANFKLGIDLDDSTIRSNLQSLLHPDPNQPQQLDQDFINWAIHNIKAIDKGYANITKSQDLNNIIIDEIFQKYSNLSQKYQIFKNKKYKEYSYERSNDKKTFIKNLEDDPYLEDILNICVYSLELLDEKNHSFLLQFFDRNPHLLNNDKLLEKVLSNLDLIQNENFQGYFNNPLIIDKISNLSLSSITRKKTILYLPCNLDTRKILFKTFDLDKQTQINTVSKIPELLTDQEFLKIMDRTLAETYVFSQKEFFFNSNYSKSEYSIEDFKNYCLLKEKTLAQLAYDKLQTLQPGEAVNLIKYITSNNLSRHFNLEKLFDSIPNDQLQSNDFINILKNSQDNQTAIFAKIFESIDQPEKIIEACDYANLESASSILKNLSRFDEVMQKAIIIKLANKSLLDQKTFTEFLTKNYLSLDKDTHLEQALKYNLKDAIKQWANNPEKICKISNYVAYNQRHLVLDQLENLDLSYHQTICMNLLNKDYISSSELTTLLENKSLSLDNNLVLSKALKYDREKTILDWMQGDTQKAKTIIALAYPSDNEKIEEEINSILSNQDNKIVSFICNNFIHFPPSQDIANEITKQIIEHNIKSYEQIEKLLSLKNTHANELIIKKLDLFPVEKASIIKQIILSDTMEKSQLQQFVTDNSKIMDDPELLPIISNKITIEPTPEFWNSNQSQKLEILISSKLEKNRLLSIQNFQQCPDNIENILTPYIQQNKYSNEEKVILNQFLSSRAREVIESPILYEFALKIDDGKIFDQIEKNISKFSHLEPIINNSEYKYCKAVIKHQDLIPGEIKVSTLFYKYIQLNEDELTEKNPLTLHIDKAVELMLKNPEILQEEKILTTLLTTGYSSEKLDDQILNLVDKQPNILDSLIEIGNKKTTQLVLSKLANQPIQKQIEIITKLQDNIFYNSTPIIIDYISKNPQLLENKELSEKLIENNTDEVKEMILDQEIVIKSSLQNWLITKREKNDKPIFHVKHKENHKELYIHLINGNMKYYQLTPEQKKLYEVELKKSLHGNWLVAVIKEKCQPGEIIKPLDFNITNEGIVISSPLPGFMPFKSLPAVLQMKLGLIKLPENIEQNIESLELEDLGELKLIRRENGHWIMHPATSNS